MIQTGAGKSRSIWRWTASQARSTSRDLTRNWPLYLMALPGIAFFIIFCYLPIGGIVIAFKDYNFKLGIFGSPWNGIENFRFFLESPDFFSVIRNTLLLNVLFIGTGLVTQVGLALMLNEIAGKWFKKINQSVMIFPNFISYIVVGVIITSFFGTRMGALNTLLAQFGIAPINWYSNSDIWPVLLVIVSIWKGTGFGSIVYLAAITGIDPELYEAAIIDGANRWQQIVHITIPGIRNLIIILLILSVGRIFSTDVGMIWAIIGDNPLLFKYCDTIDTFVFRNLRNNPDMGMTTAVGLMQSVVGFFLVLGTNIIVKKYYPEGSIF